MNTELEQLVCEVTDLTGAARPDWLEEESPLLQESAIAARNEDQDYYFIGVIGGKDVGKSALINALVGQKLSQPSSHGPGTERAIAYVHQDFNIPVGQLLEREVPGRYLLMPHTIASLRRQVLLDLPDIDSHYADHLDTTRRMLRHMLYPIWMQSVEKYADRRPQELLARVAAGNAPDNFIFCLNKVDQLCAAVAAVKAQGGADAFDPTALPPAFAELQEDYASRLKRVLHLPQPPRVWMISATTPDRFEFGPLREFVMRTKTPDAVRDSRAKAGQRQAASVLSWLKQQDLSGRSERLGRLYETADALISERIGIPLMEDVLPALTADPAHKAAIIEECTYKRIARWPMMGVLNGMMSGIGRLFRRSSDRAYKAVSSNDAFSLIDAHLARLALQPAAADTARTGAVDPEEELPVPLENIDGNVVLTTLLQGTFAQLQQSNPQISTLYQARKLWEPMTAATAAGDLRRGLGHALDRQRKRVSARMAREGGVFARFGRWLFTVGAILWFPIVQPLLAMLIEDTQPLTLHRVLSQMVNVLSVGYLLDKVVFLLIYFAGLWMFLRWDTQRRINISFEKWQSADATDPLLSPSGKTLEWLSSLLEPIRAARDRLDLIVKRMEAIAVNQRVPRKKKWRRFEGVED